MFETFMRGSSIILIIINFEPVWIKRGNLLNTTFYRGLVGGLWGGYTYHDKCPTSWWNLTNKKTVLGLQGHSMKMWP